MIELYNNDNKNLLISYLDTYFLPGIKHTTNNEWVRGETIELIFNTVCDQHCSYCYINKYGHELFPDGKSTSKETYLKNLDLLLDFLFEHKIFISRWELFAGNLLKDNMLFEIIDKLYYRFNNLFSTNPKLFEDFVEIIIPTSLSGFYNNLELQNKFITYQEKCRLSHIEIGVSWSTDGLFCISHREKKELPKDYYDQMFTFTKKINAGYHPMISPENVENWVDNYHWWIEQYQKYDLDTHSFQPYMLEVRNDGWTREKIAHYLNFLKEVFLKRCELCNYSIEEMAYHFFKGDGQNGTLRAAPGGDPLRLVFSNDVDIDNERLACSMQSMCVIYLGDLSLPICHRCAYSYLNGGKFKIENDKIVDIEPKNVSIYLTSKLFKQQAQPLCNKCEQMDVCIKGCLGAQYEVYGELFCPIESVCELEKAKNSFIVKLLLDNDILETANNLGYLNPQQKQYFTNICRLHEWKLNW